MPKVEDIYEGVHGEASRRLLGRGEFLRLALGAGAGMALSGSLGAFGAGGARAADMLGGEFPIGAWWPPPPNQTTVERYREIKDAGFNFVIGGNGVANDVNNAKALEAAAGNDVRLVLTDYDLHQRIRGVSGARAAQSAADGAGGFERKPDAFASRRGRASSHGGRCFRREPDRKAPPICGRRSGKGS
ncbi:MAG: hypothetical protein M3494_09410 [Actinomycetota bacterium]|nr:hypothetical protein [Actinomycetota bacterium]